MAWYNGTFSCGHEGRVNVIGPSKDRQWKIDRKFSGVCEECYEKQLLEEREKANKEAAEKSKEMELPELTGSEKQVAWANTLRQKLIDKFEEFKDFEEYSFEELHTILDYILINKTQARYYIDNRDNNIYEYIDKEKNEALKSADIKAAEKNDKKLYEEIKLESTVFPESRVTNAVAEITVSDEVVSVVFERNETFRTIVKNLYYVWEGGRWQKEISEITGTAADRAAELGNKLLNAGFPIMMLDENIRQKAIAGDFEPECNRWVMLRSEGEYKGQLVIKWWEQSDKLYKAAKSIPGAHWNNGGMILKVMHYKEVGDFATLCNFKFTKLASEAIEQYKEQLEKVETVQPTKVEEVQLKDGLKEILNSSTDILEDLRED